jgi:type III restriction enzyme
MPKFRNLWEHIGAKMPKKGRGKAASHLDPLSLPAELQTALHALYGHYRQTYEQWTAARIEVPPVFIVVCNNTSTSKLVYDFISGFERLSNDGERGEYQAGRLSLFRNYDDYGNRLAQPRTLLIDSRQLESGEALDKDFREAATHEIERFRREIVMRTGDQRAGDTISDADLLREAMNTVGKPGRLGASIRCVVSVSMLTEGWDANTVTHILGVRAFSTQLLCEQVVGRALRRQSYDLNESGQFNAEYADVLGIPFDFAAKPVVVAPSKPLETIRVHAVCPERDTLEICFPRVEGYRIELPNERLTASFSADSALHLTPALVGPSITRNQGIVGTGVDLTVAYLQEMRKSSIVYKLTEHLLYQKFRDPGEEPKIYLFGQLKRIARQWLDNCLTCTGGTYPAQLLYQEIAEMACEKIHAAITASLKDERPVKAVLDAYNPVGSTRYINFTTSRTERWQTDFRPEMKRKPTKDWTANEAADYTKYCVLKLEKK